MDDLRNWAFGILMFFVAAGSLLYNILTGRTGEWRKEVEAVSARLDDVETTHTSFIERMARIEERLHHLPDKETVHRIDKAVARIESRLLKND